MVSSEQGGKGRGGGGRAAEGQRWARKQGCKWAREGRAAVG
jgi:hypothetical protein